jgi:hypothetical protein
MKFKNFFDKMLKFLFFNLSWILILHKNIHVNFFDQYLIIYLIYIKAFGKIPYTLTHIDIRLLHQNNPS